MAETLAAIGSSGAANDEKKNDEFVNVQKKVFYRTDDDSGGAECLRKLRCGCLEPRYILSTEAVKVEKWQGCSKINNSIDLDEIRDLSLSQFPGCAFCLFGVGTIHLFTEKDGVSETHTIRNVEHSQEVFSEFSKFVHHINNLKFGIKRPELADMPHMIYDSNADPCLLKCCRSSLSCKFCCFPTTLVTKEHIITSAWTMKCQKKTQQFDLDHVTEVELRRNICDYLMCVGAGTITISGSDADQAEVKIVHCAESAQVHKKLDEYVNLLNNRERLLGTEMSR